MKCRQLRIARSISLLTVVAPLLAAAGTAPTTQPSRPATTRSTTTSTSRPADEPPDELDAAMEKLAKSVPQDVADGKREPTDREKMAAQFLLVLSAATNGLNNDKTPEKFRQENAETDKQLDEQFAKAREKLGKDSEAARQELAIIERLTRERAHILDFLQRPSTFPTTRASRADLARRVEQIPRILDRAEDLDRDTTYHGKRLELLTDIDELRQKTPQLDHAGRQRIEAETALLTALDAEYKAQLSVDQLNRQASKQK